MTRDDDPELDALLNAVASELRRPVSTDPWLTKRVMAGSVTVTGPPSAIWRANTSSAEPRDPSTFPKRTLANTVG